MVKKTLTVTRLMLLGAAVILVPSVGIHFLERYEYDSFRQDVMEDRTECLKDVGDDPRLGMLCERLASQTQDAYVSAVETSWSTRLILLGLIFGMAVGLASLKLQLTELKERLDV